MNKGLNSFRTFAFLSVFFFHFEVFGCGYLGVQAFFVLSGFLITSILVNMKSDLSTYNYFKNFYGRRILRIFPLYYFFLIGLWIISYLAERFIEINHLHAIDNFQDQFLWALTYTYNFLHASTLFKHTPLVTHFWSLAVEEQFYLIWPFAIFLINKKNLKTFLIIVMILGPIIRLFTGYIVDIKYSVHILNVKDLVIYVLPFSHLDAFATGGFFAIYRKSIKVKWVWVFIAGTILAGITTSYIFTGNAAFTALGYTRFMSDSYKYIWGYTLMNIMFGLILSNLKDHKFLPTVFENNWLDYLGKISYGLYVYHFPVIYVVISLLDFAPKIIQIPIALVLTIIISMLSYEYFEKKFLLLKDRLFPT